MKKDGKQRLFEVMERLDPSFEMSEASDTNEINPEIKEEYDKSIQYLDKYLSENETNLKKAEYYNLSNEILLLKKEILGIMATAKYVFDNPDFWINQKNQKEYFYHKYDFKNFMFDNKVPEIDHHIESQTEFFNPDNKVPQPKWLHELKPLVDKIRPMFERQQVLRNEVRGI